MQCEVVLEFSLFGFMALWLASFPDSFRDGGKRRAGVYSGLPPDPVLRDSLVSLGGEGFDANVLPSLRKPYCKSGKRLGAHDVYGGAELPSKGFLVSSLVKLDIDDCTHEHGVMTYWNGQCRPQLESLNKPRDAYSLRIADVRQCKTLHTICLRQDGDNEFDNVDFISKGKPLGRCIWPPSAAPFAMRRSRWNPFNSSAEPDDQPLQADQLLRAWNVHISPDDVPVLVVPFPVVFLIEHRTFEHVILLVRWHAILHGQRPRWLSHAERVSAPKLTGPVASWPPDSSPVWDVEAQRQEEVHPPQEIEPLTAQNMEAFANQLRFLFSDLPPVLDRGTLCEWETLVEQCEAWRTTLMRVEGMDAHRSGSIVYESEFLVECLRLLPNIRGGPTKLADVVARSAPNGRHQSGPGAQLF